MSAEDLIKELELSFDVEIDQVEEKFIETLRDRLQVIAENFDEDEVSGEEAWLKTFHENFFDYAHKWAKREAVKRKGEPQHHDAEGLKKEALSVLTDLQKYIIEFASCYMHINRFATLLRDEIRNKEEHLGQTAKKIKWSPDMGVMLARRKKEQNDLVRSSSKMAEARKVLESIESNFLGVSAGLHTLFGNKAEPYLRSFNAALRIGNVAKAQKALAAIEKGKKKFGLDQKTATEIKSSVNKHGKIIIAVIAEHAEVLSTQDKKLFLKPIETDRYYNSQIQDLKKIRIFLGKYHLPYMQHKLEYMYHLKEKLMLAGTLDSLMVLYKLLIKGVAQPMADIKTTRSYESEVLQHVKYLLSSQFAEIPLILKRAHETVEEFRQNNEDFDAIRKMAYNEKDIPGEKPAASAPDKDDQDSAE